MQWLQIDRSADDVEHKPLWPRGYREQADEGEDRGQSLAAQVRQPQSAGSCTATIRANVA